MNFMQIYLVQIIQENYSLLLYSCLLFLAVYISINLFLTLLHSDIKRAFNVPWFYKVTNHDLGVKPNKYYIGYKGVVGTPDVIFKHFLLPIWIVGEAKSRCAKNNSIIARENYQVQLYIGIIKKTKIISFISGKIKFSNCVVDLTYDHKTFKNLIKLKHPALKFLKQIKSV